MNIFSIYFLLVANVVDADDSWVEHMAGLGFVETDSEETNSDTGKNNHKLIIQ